MGFIPPTPSCILSLLSASSSYERSELLPVHCLLLHRAIWTYDCYCLSSLLSSPLSQVCLLYLSFANVVSASSARLSTIKRSYQSLSRHCWFSFLFAFCRLLLLCSSHVPVWPIPCLLLDKVSHTLTPLAPSPSCHSPLLLYAALLHPPDSCAAHISYFLGCCVAQIKVIGVYNLVISSTAAPIKLCMVPLSSFALSWTNPPSAGKIPPYNNPYDLPPTPYRRAT